MRPWNKNAWTFFFLYSKSYCFSCCMFFPNNLQNWWIIPLMSFLLNQGFFLRRRLDCTMWHGTTFSWEQGGTPKKWTRIIRPGNIRAFWLKKIYKSLKLINITTPWNQQPSHLRIDGILSFWGSPIFRGELLVLGSVSKKKHLPIRGFEFFWGRKTNISH